jgi:hypothetical protein
MENDQLDKLTEFILKNGELSEKEKDLLIKKAVKFGIDPIEFEKALRKKLDKFDKNKF